MNTSEEFANFSHILSPSKDEVCLKGKYFGFIFNTLIMGLCFLVGTPAHLWCLWLYFRSKKKIRDTQVFVLNHTVMEIIYSIECGMEILNWFTINNTIVWNVLLFFFGLSWTGRPLLQACICFEQYLAVIYPVTFVRYKGIKYRIAETVAAWLMAFAYGVYWMSTLIFPDITYTIIFGIALCVILFCCVSVLCALKHPGPGDTHVTQQTVKYGGNQQKRKAFNTIFSALLLILFTYLPQALLMIFTVFQVDELMFVCTIAPFMTSLNIFGVIITPLLKLYKVSKGNHHEWK